MTSPADFNTTPVPLSGVRRIATERTRQVIEEGYDALHDAGHADQLASAADAYVNQALLELRHAARTTGSDMATRRETPPYQWPWATRFWKPTADPVTDLTKAGALIAAAIDSILHERARTVRHAADDTTEPDDA